MFHGMGCVVTFPDGEVLDVDFWEAEGLTIDPWFFARRIASLASPGLVERRVQEMFPTSGLLVHALGHLRQRGVLWHSESSHVFRLPARLEDPLLRVASPVTPAEQLVWHRHLGDFDHPALGEHEQGEARRRHLAHLLMALPSMPEAVTALVPRAPAEMIVESVTRLLERPIDAATGSLVEQLDQHTSLPFCDAVREVLRRLRAGHDHPYPAHAVVRYLLRRRQERDLAMSTMLSFARVARVEGYEGNPFLGRFALLALEHAPEHAIDLIRRALRSNTPLCRNEVAAALVVLGHRWCAEELVAALADQSGWSSTAEIRSALARLEEPTARAVAERWWRAHGPPPHEGPGFSWDEVAEANRNGFLELEIERLAPVLGPLRASLERLPEP